jgi:hypothetical protein
MAEGAEIGRRMPTLGLVLVRHVDHLGSFFPTRGLFSSRGVGCGLPRMSRITPPAF